MVKKSVKKVKKSSQGSSHKSMPLGVKIISIGGYVLSILMIILGIFFIFGSSFMVPLINTAISNAALTNEGIPAELEKGLDPSIFNGIIIGAGVIILVLGVAGILVSRGLWKGRRWARIVVIILSFLGAINALFSLDIPGLAINLVVGLYLFLSKDVKKAFA